MRQIYLKSILSLDVTLETAFMPNAMLGWLLVRRSFNRVGRRSICQLQTLFGLYKCSFFLFFVTWFRARTRVR